MYTWMRVSPAATIHDIETNRHPGVFHLPKVNWKRRQRLHSLYLVILYHNLANSNHFINLSGFKHKAVHISPTAIAVLSWMDQRLGW